MNIQSLLSPGSDTAADPAVDEDPVVGAGAPRSGRLRDRAMDGGQEARTSGRLIDRLGVWAGDGLAVGLLAAVVVWLAWHDGGLEIRSLLVVAGLGLATVPWAVAEARRLAVGVQVLFGCWGTGVAASLVFAQVRANFVEPALIVGLMPLVFLATRRIWRRRWGPPALVGLLLVGFGAYWHRSFMQWWGQALFGFDQRWMPLSWHNQSGVLMGALGLSVTGFALLGKRVLALAGGLVAAMAFAGVWLSSSRAAPVFTLVAFLVVVVLATRRRGLRRAAARGVAVLCAAAAVVAGLTVLATVSGGDGGQPVGQREQSAGGNLLMRLNHMQAAVGMTGDDPVTGQGLGSYKLAAPAWTPADGGLTVSAHNEYVQMFGEAGVLAGVGFAGLALAGLALGLREVRRRPAAVGSGVGPGLEPGLRSTLKSGIGSGVESETGSGVDPRNESGSESGSATQSQAVRRHAAAGAVGVVALIGGHALIDFDMAYPVIPALFAVAAGILSLEAVRVRGWRLTGSAPGAQSTDVAAGTETGGPANGLDTPDGSGETDRAAGGVAGSAGRVGSWSGAVAALAGLVAVLVAGVAGGVVEQRANVDQDGLNAEEYAAAVVAWDVGGAESAAATLSADGEHELARSVLDRAITWNPGVARLYTQRAIVDYRAGRTSAVEVADTVSLRQVPFWVYNMAAETLIDGGDPAVAKRLLDEAMTAYPEFRAWGVTEVKADSERLLARIEG